MHIRIFCRFLPSFYMTAAFPDSCTASSSAHARSKRVTRDTNLLISNLGLTFALAIALQPAFSQTSTGFPTFATVMHPSNVESINLSGMAVIVTVPVRSKPGVIPFDQVITKSNLIYQKV